MDKRPASQAGGSTGTPVPFVRRLGRLVHTVFILPYAVVWGALRTIWASPQSRSALLAGAWLLVAGTVVFMLVERLSALDAFYFSFVAITTIGFGDIAPQTDLGKVLTVAYGLIGLGIFAAVIRTIAVHHSRVLKDRDLVADATKPDRD